MRFVRALIEQGLASEDTIEGRQVCRIFSRRVYRALGAEDIRHRRIASQEVLLRRLLSLDYVLEHTELTWLPTEPEKVGCFERLGISRRRLPARTYQGAVGKTRRYFALKLPIAVEADSAVFVYVDPGHSTDKALRSWGAAHRGLWEALRSKGRPVQVVTVARKERALAASRNGAAQLGQRFRSRDWRRRSFGGSRIRQDQAGRAHGRYGPTELLWWRDAALKRAIELQPLAENRPIGVVIDSYSIWRTTRLLEGEFERS